MPVPASCPDQRYDESEQNWRQDVVTSSEYWTNIRHAFFCQGKQCAGRMSNHSVSSESSLVSSITTVLVEKLVVSRLLQTSKQKAKRRDVIPSMCHVGHGWLKLFSVSALNLHHLHKPNLFTRSHRGACGKPDESNPHTSNLFLWELL